MKDFEALSRKHFDRQAAEYDQRDTYYYSQHRFPPDQGHDLYRHWKERNSLREPEDAAL